MTRHEPPRRALRRSPFRVMGMCSCSSSPGCPAACVSVSGFRLRRGEPNAEGIAMRRAFLSSALLAGGLFAAACTEQRSPLPTEAPRFDLSPSSCPTAPQIDPMITALFPSGDLLMSAQDFFNNIKVKVKKGDPASLAVAQSKTLKFVDFTIKNYRRGKLLDPNGAADPTTQT